MKFIFNFFVIVVFLSVSELFLLVNIAAKFGIGITLLLCILTGIGGGAIIRLQGIDTLKNIKNSLQKGTVPADEIVSGLMLLILGAFLMVPGFITDTMGFILLIKPVRMAVAKGFVRALKNNITILGKTSVYNTQSNTMDFDEENGMYSQAIDADYTEE